MDMITIEREDDWFVITDEESGVTTQGETKLEALLMQADALAGYEDADEDLSGTSRRTHRNASYSECDQPH